MAPSNLPLISLTYWLFHLSFVPLKYELLEDTTGTLGNYVYTAKHTMTGD